MGCMTLGRVNQGVKAAGRSIGRVGLLLDLLLSDREPISILLCSVSQAASGGPARATMAARNVSSPFYADI